MNNEPQSEKEAEILGIMLMNLICKGPKSSKGRWGLTNSVELSTMAVLHFGKKEL